ncbi:hypothetical protein BCR16_12730 [Ralstonia solanacearum FJAT-1458]|nr:hypothetical protein BCR16_12730 [Ralstonia solanacearum FJAT-1458]
MHRYVIGSAGDAIRALCRMVPGFEAELMASGDRGIRYAVFAGKRNLDEKQLTHPSGSSDIRIAPVLVGSKQAGLFQVLAGAVLMVVGAVSMYFGNAYGPQMMMMGAALALGGIAQMMAPQPATDGGFSSRTSYNFNGAQNITQQGGPVPLLYGRMRIGSVVISEGMLAKDGTAQLIGGHPVAVT